MTAQTHAFQAEVQQLLRILIHSLYSHKEIFLRELISNAVDALDKMRFLQLTEKVEEDLPFEVKIECDELHHRLTITDTGIGMTREELIENIGTIARSGTAEFLKRLSAEEKKNTSLIGQFGVGFYSVFMVAEKVRLITRSWKSGSETVVWESDGSGTFTLDEHATSSRGTRIEIDLRQEESEFSKPARIREIIQTHSRYVPYPIKLGGDVANEVTALWTRSKSQISTEEYKEFYQFITGQDDEPLSTLHFSLDTPLSLQALLYVPKTNVELAGFGRTESKLSLYTRRVLIQAECKDLVPEYLRFLKGVVDTEDLPLNVSRETFQHNRIIINIKRQLVRKVLAHFTELAEKEPESYTKFFQEFGRYLKEGYQSDNDNREKLTALLRWNSTTCDNDQASVSLAQYVERMKEDQKEIYFLSGGDRTGLLKSPHLEVFKKKGIEVLLITDPLDDLLLSTMQNYQGKELRSADEAGLNLKLEDQADESLAYRGKLSSLLDAMKKALADRVLDVRESHRLEESPCALVNPQEGATAGIQKLMNLMNKDFVMSKRILEINAKHPMVRNLVDIHHEDPDDALLGRAYEQLVDAAMLLEGLPVSPETLVSRMQQTLAELAQLKAKK